MVDLWHTDIRHIVVVTDDTKLANQNKDLFSHGNGNISQLVGPPHQSKLKYP